MKNKIDIDNLQQSESNEEFANIDAIFSSIENLSSEISDLGIDFQFDRSIFDESIENKDKEAFMESLNCKKVQVFMIWVLIL